MLDVLGVSSTTVAIEYSEGGAYRLCGTPQYSLHGRLNAEVESPGLDTRGIQNRPSCAVEGGLERALSVGSRSGLPG